MTPDALEELLEETEDLVFKEMYDGRYERVDAVMGPAHQMRFVVVKAMTGATIDVPRELTMKSLAIADPPARFVFGVAYAHSRADGQREWMSRDEVEQAAWGFLRNGGQVGMYHADGTLGHADVVESSVWRGPDWVTKDIAGRPQTIRAGDWCLGAILDEPAFDLVRRGKADGWSLDGVARRRIKAPPVRKSDGPFDELLASVDQLLATDARSAAGRRVPPGSY